MIEINKYTMTPFIEIKASYIFILFFIISAMNNKRKQLPPDPICQSLKPTVPPRTAVMNIEFAQSAHPNAISPNQSWTFVRDKEDGKTLVTVETMV